MIHLLLTSLLLVFNLFAFSLSTVLAQTDGCEFTGNPTRPGGNCEGRVPYVHKNIDDYQLTCAVTPEVYLERYTCDSVAVNASIGNDGPPPATIVDGKEYIDARLLVDLSSLELGGLGPDASSWSSSPDLLAKSYPYNALADKPLEIDENTPKESYRTFWRLLTLRQQLEAKGWFLTRFRATNNPVYQVFTDLSQFLGGGTRFDQPIFDSEFPITPGSSSYQALADYMNAVIENVNSDKIKLLSPAFNVTSNKTKDIVEGMTSAGANWSALAAFAGNTYTLSGQNALVYYANFMKGFVTSQGKRIVFTEFGDFGLASPTGRDQVIQDMKTTFQNAQTDSSILGILYFNALNTNTGFAFNALSGEEMRTIMGTGGRFGGANSAANINTITRGFPTKLCEHFTGNVCPPPGTPPGWTSPVSWTLEIASGPQDLANTIAAVNQTHALGMTPIVRICAGDTCDFKDPTVYVKFLNDVAAAVSQPFYAIAGPNEPDLEHWIDGEDASTDSDENVFKLSELLGELPECLKTHPLPTRCGLIGQVFPGVIADLLGADTPEEVYNALVPELKEKYDALQPFTFDNVRGYLAMRYVDTSGNQRVGILAENLPYIQALRDIIGDPVSGILTSISPNWLVSKREQELYTSDDYDLTYSETGTLNLTNESSKYFQSIADKTLNIWAHDNICRNLDIEKTMSLASPKTLPLKLPNRNFAELQATGSTLDQSILVPVQTSVNPSDSNCPIPGGGFAPSYRTTIRSESIRDAGQAIRDLYGRTIAVLNNPKLTDLNRLISQPINDDLNLSLYSQMLPSTLGLEPAFPSNLVPGPNYTAMNEEAPYMEGSIGNYSSALAGSPPSTQYISAGSTGNVSAPVRRLGGQSHTDLCRLRNFWLRPSGLQVGEPEDCEDIGTLSSSSSQTPPPQAAPVLPNDPGLAFCDAAPAPSGHNVKPIDSLISALQGTVWNPKAASAITSEANLRRCYNYVINAAIARSADPAHVMATWIEESGASNYAKFNPVDDLGVGGGINNNLPLQLERFTNLQYAYSRNDNHAACRALDAPTPSLNIMEYFQIYACGDNACRRTPATYDFSCTYTDDNTTTRNWPNQLNQAYQAVHVNSSSIDFNKVLPSSNWAR